MTKKKVGFLHRLGMEGDLSDPENKRKITYTIIASIAAILIIPKLIGLILDLNLFAEEPEPFIFQADAVVAEASYLEDLISSTGTVRAIQEIDLSSETSGKVIGLYINEGSEVSAGDLLVKVNDNDLQAELARLESNIELFEETSERQQQLFERGGATQEDYDNTLMQLNNLRAEHATVRVQIDRTEVRAPFDGIVGLTYISEGAYVTPSTRIASLQNTDSVRVDFTIPERYSANVRMGSQINFEVQGVDSLFTGEVIATEPQIDPRTRTVQVRAVAENTNRLLNPGAFANVELVLSAFDEALVVPSVALVPDNGSFKVLVYQDGKVRESFVETGIRLRDRIQILSGIAPGDTVLVNGLMQLSEGSDVEIRNLNQIADL